MSWGGGLWMGGGGAGPAAPAGGVLAASAVLVAARAKHPAFSPEAIPNDVALIELGTIQRDLLSLAQERNPDFRLETATVSLTPFAAVHTLPAYDYVRDVAVVFASGQQGAMNRVDASDRFRPAKRYSGYYENDTLTLIGSARDWTGVTELQVRYCPIVVDPVTLDTGVFLPNSSLGALRAMMAAFMARRCVALGIEGVDVADFAQQAATAQTIWLSKVAGAGRPRAKQITAVW